MKIPPAEILAAFDPYRPDGYTATKAITNLESKINDRVQEQLLVHV